MRFLTRAAERWISAGVPLFSLAVVPVGAGVRASAGPVPTVGLRTAAGPARTAGAQARAPRHVALLIGISDYLHFDLEGEPGKTDLEGPVNDAERIRIALRRFGFDGEDVRTLLDEEASLEGIEAGFRWVAERATDTADVVVVFYAGHGSHAPDTDGDEAEVTPGDDRDEVLVPWDASDIHDAEQLVTDDLIREWLEAIGTPNVTVIVDACYSGTVTRGEAVAPVARARGPVGNVAPGAGMDPLGHPAHTLLTAASAYQVARELPFGDGGRVNGVFTYHLARVLDGVGPGVRYDDLIQEVRVAMSGEPSDQTPQLEGEGAARLFRIGERMARRPFLVLADGADGRYELDGGALHGVRRASVYDVYGPGEMAFEPGSSLGQVRVDSVGEGRAWVRPVGGAGREAGFPDAARAIRSRVPLGAAELTRVGVRVTPPSGAAAAALRSLSFVRVVEGGAAGDESAREAEAVGAEEAFAEVREEGGVARVFVHGFALPPLIRDADWVREAVVGGKRIRGFEPSAGGLCPVLKRAYAIATFEEIENQEPPPGLDLRLRVVPAGAGPPVQDEGASANPTDTLRLGSAYDVVAYLGVGRNDERALATNFYLTAAVEGYISMPTTLYPLEEDPAPFPLNQWHTLLSSIPPEEPVGHEVIRVVANSEPYDFRGLTERVEGLECGATRGWPPAAEEAEEPTVEPVTGWTSLKHKILILPGGEGGGR